ncbi:V-type ATP synthase subunit E [Carnobacterium gallinarum]|uniref:V-type ATP synthase subunit E n=1 Tax=Carnobacterium gallinarum TaxID=2749 RepID=UPI000554CBEA|nr:hypothetical protein [Carnobacterium gallinarum]
MSDLKKLTSQMIERVEAEVAKELVETRSQAEIIVLNGEHQIEEMQKVQQQKIAEEQLQDYQLQLNAYKVKLRNQLLAEKQQILSDCFKAALAEMSHWNTADFQQFVEGVLLNLQPEESIELVLGEQSKDVLSKEWLANIAETNHWKIVLSPEYVANEAGFVLRIAGIDYNFCFASLIAEQRENLIPLLAGKLFP